MFNKENIVYKLSKKIYRKILFPLYFNYGTKRLPINPRKVVVDNFSGRGYGDNPKYIVDELLKLNDDLDIVWEVTDPDEIVPKGVRKTRFNRISGIKELATAGVWIDNVKSKKPIKKKGQFYLQTWHGGIALKGIENQVEKYLPVDYIENSKRDSKQIDLMISDSKWTTSLFSTDFWYKGKVVETGFPRNDVLVKEPEEVINKVYNFFKIKKDKKILLYAPTFRDNNPNLNVFNFDFNKIVSFFNKKFDSEYVTLIRLHPNVVDLMKKNNIFNFDNKKLFDATLYPDMQELLVACDVLITDYSSSMFDAMIAKKKIFILAKDYKEYATNDRPLLFNIKQDLPFTFSQNLDELKLNVANYDKKEYEIGINKFIKSLELKEDGNASKRVAKIIMKQIKSCEDGIK